jgi:hypothetical protein
MDRRRTYRRGWRSPWRLIVRSSMRRALARRLCLHWASCWLPFYRRPRVQRVAEAIVKRGPARQFDLFEHSPAWTAIPASLELMLPRFPGHFSMIGTERSPTWVERQGRRTRRAFASRSWSCTHRGGDRRFGQGVRLLGAIDLDLGEACRASLGVAR